MSDTSPCPACFSVYTYEDRGLYICPECAHEWTATAVAEEATTEPIIRDANGNVLKDGDTVTVIKDLKVKGSSSVVKLGMKGHEHPRCAWRSQHRLQDSRRWLDDVEVRVCA